MRIVGWLTFVPWLLDSLEQSSLLVVWHSSVLRVAALESKWAIHGFVGNPTWGLPLSSFVYFFCLYRWLLFAPLTAPWLSTCTRFPVYILFSPLQNSTRNFSLPPACPTPVQSLPYTPVPFGFLPHFVAAFCATRLVIELVIMLLIIIIFLLYLCFLIINWLDSNTFHYPPTQHPPPTRTHACKKSFVLFTHNPLPPPLYNAHPQPTTPHSWTITVVGLWNDLFRICILPIWIDIWKNFRYILKNYFNLKETREIVSVLFEKSFKNIRIIYYFFIVCICMYLNTYIQMFKALMNKFIAIILYFFWSKSKFTFHLFSFFILYMAWNILRYIHIWFEIY